MIKVDDLICPNWYTNNPSNWYTVLEINNDKIVARNNTTKRISNFEISDVIVVEDRIKKIYENIE